jgi:hypothetical protein
MEPAIGKLYQESRSDPDRADRARGKIRYRTSGWRGS